MGDVIGMLTDNALAAGIGVVGSYLFTVTGRDHPFIKGVTHGHLSWLVAYRILARMGANPIKSADPVTQGVTWFSPRCLWYNPGLSAAGHCRPQPF